MVQPSGIPPQQYAPYQPQPPAQPGPYYGPPPLPQPRTKSSGAILAALIVVVVVVVVIVLAGMGALLSSSAPATPVTVTGVSWNINYNGASSGYFGPSPQSACSACPFSRSAGSQLPYTLS